MFRRHVRARPGGHARRDSLRRRARRLRRPAWFGTMRRTTPLSDSWGIDRGTPVDRFYIERFLERYRADIGGRVLEVRDSRYATQLGTSIDAVDVIDLDASNPLATIVSDLSAADEIPAESFDCFILTQTLQYIADLEEAISHSRRILKADGVLLMTVPGISGIDRRHAESDLWRFTPQICSRLFAASWSGDEVEVISFGNVLSATAFLFGMGREELTERELTASDLRYPVTIGVRAVKRSRTR
jgi:SAM-dependent methyltransferase